MSQVRSITIGIVVDVGPKDETPEQSGMSHLVEHLMFKGTSSRDTMQIARLMDMAGGMMGGFTARDYTCYFATVLDDYRTYALDLFGDVILNSTFDEESLERERGVVLQEMEASQDAPGQLAHDLLKATVWPHHPLGRLIAGQPKVVEQVTREDMIYFVHEHYLPDRLTIAAAGNLEHEDFVAQVRDAFWRMLGQSKPTASTRPEYQAGVTIEHKPVSQAYFSLGMRAYPYAHPDRYGLHFLNNVLGGGVSSRLFRRIREERGLVYDINSEYHAYRDDGLLVVEGSTAPEYLISVLALTLVELWKLISTDEPVDDEELWKAKMHIRGQHLVGSESTHTRTSRLATQELYFGRHIPSDEILAQIEAVDGQLLQRLAHEALIDALRRVTIAVVGPEAPQHYSVSSIEELLASLQ
jgi:predicted Zn-dependent peptidase